LPDVEDLIGGGSCGEQRVVAQNPGVTVCGAPFPMAVDPAGRRIRVDRYRLVAGARTHRPRPSKDHLEGPVELAGVTERERHSVILENTQLRATASRTIGLWHPRPLY